MPHSLDQLLPSLQSLGVWTYWVIGAFALLEAVVLTGLVVPGSLAVIAGGVLAQRGVIDFFDLAWFVAIATFLGSQVSFYLGQLAARGVGSGRRLSTSSQAARAKELLIRRGGAAVLIGRFLGPISAFVPFAAALARMDQRRFVVWNAVSAALYGLTHPAIGYLSAGALGTIGAAAPRILAFAAGMLGVLALLWYLVGRIRRALPWIVATLQDVLTWLLASGPVRRFAGRHPRIARLLLARFRTTEFFGLTATILAILFLYLLGAYLDSVYDFMRAGDGVTLDDRLASLLYVLRDPRLIGVFGSITQFGGWKVVAVLLVAASASLVALRRLELLAGLWITVVGNQITVALLKSFFGRERSLLGYFVETSGSFPSGHAASSVAIWGMLFYLAWRTRLLPALVAAVAAVTTAFLIGLSRLYLIEHYLSDVLNGYLVGALWLTLGIAFCEWRQDRRSVVPVTRNRRLAAFSSIGLGIVLAVGIASAVSKPLNPAVTPRPTTIANMQALFRSGDLPRATETLLGTRRQRIDLVVEAEGPEALAAVMTVAGWKRAPIPGPTRLARAALTYWTGGTAPTALIFPTFWNGQPNDLGFFKPATPGRPWHARFWESGYRTPDGASVFVATVAAEDPLYWIDDKIGGAPSTLPAAELKATVSAISGEGTAAIAVAR